MRSRKQEGGAGTKSRNKEQGGEQEQGAEVGKKSGDHKSRSKEK